METIRNPSISCLFVTLLQKVWDIQYYKQLLLSNDLLDKLIIHSMASHHCLSDELFVFVKSVLPVIHDRISPDSRRTVSQHAIKLLYACLSASKEEREVPGLEDGIFDVCFFSFFFIIFSSFLIFFVFLVS